MDDAVGARDALLAAARAELVEHGYATISLRAVARRAGVSHAAPKYHFGDRAGLLTAVATEGFTAFAEALEGAGTAGDLTALGHAYIDFALAHPALFDLMWSPGELRPDDPGLLDASLRAYAALTGTVAALTERLGEPDADVELLSLACWAEVHGAVALARSGALGGLAGDRAAGGVAALARQVTGVLVGRAFGDPPGHPG